MQVKQTTRWATRTGKSRSAFAAFVAFEGREGLSQLLRRTRNERDCGGEIGTIKG